MTRRILPLLLSLCLCVSSMAGPKEERLSAPTAVEIAELPEATARELAASSPTVEELRNLNDEAHETLEGDDDDRHWLRKLVSIRSWKEKLNFARTLTNAGRWFAIRGGDTRTYEHVVNLVVMYGGSHFFETMAGGALASWAADPTNAAPWVAKALAGVIGFTIVVPGLDPVCILLGRTYYRYPKAMHTLLTPPRFFVIRVLGPVAKYTGIQATAKLAWRLLFHSEEGSAFLQRVMESDRSGLVYRYELNDGVMSVRVLGEDGTTPVAHLKLRSNADGAMLLESVHLWPDAPLNRATLKNALRPLGYNISTAVLEASDNLRVGKIEFLENRVYITAVSPAEESGTRVTFRRPAIGLGMRHRFRAWPWMKNTAIACARFLGGASPLMVPPPLPYAK